MKSTFDKFPSFKYELNGHAFQVYFNGLFWRCAISGVMYSLTDYNFSSKAKAKKHAERIINNDFNKF